MLKFNIKLSEPKTYDEISYRELYLSPDMTFISGVTNSDYYLVDGQKVLIEFNQNETFIETIASVKKVTRQGYVMFNQVYNVETFIGKINKDQTNTYYCVRYIDGRYYFSKEGEANISINGKTYTVNTNDNTIMIPTKYWVEDGIVKIGDISYDTDIILFRKKKNDNKIVYEVDETPTITLKNGTKLKIEECDKVFWKEVTKFILRKKEDYKLTIDYVSCTTKKYYVEYGYNDKSILKHYFKYDENGTLKVKINNHSYIFDSNMFITVNNMKLQIKYEWVNSFNGNFINLFVDNSKFRFAPSQKILVKSISTVPSHCEKINDEYFLYCGKKYYPIENKTIDYAVINDKEYLITYTEKNWGIENLNLEKEKENDYKYGYIYINFYDEPTPIIISGNKCIVYSIYNNNTSFKKALDVKSYKYIVIDNKNFLIKSYKISNKREIEYVDVNLKENYILSVDEVISNNLLRCHPCLNNGDDLSSITSSLVQNKNNYNFYLYNELIPSYNVTKEGAFNALTNEQGKDEIGIFNYTTLMNIPIVLDNDVANNINQNDIVQNYFSKREIEKSINPYVDMEREIYYPCNFIENNGIKKFETVNEIKFNLHFRTRNLEKWTINEDLTLDLENANLDKDNYPKCDWNIFDYYTLNVAEKDKKVVIDSENYNEYSQPADLLGFLNFTNDDIFYQKSKVGKSFLRLSFYNSNDPLRNSLLYTCTVFMDEGLLFKKYLDCLSKKDTKYVSAMGLKDAENNFSMTDSVNVSYDTCDEDRNVTFIENRRLSASFSVKNRYNSHESAEGFYLYIFKEYCEKLHEEPLYMKIEFNHAGEGRTVNLTVPFEITNDGEYRLLNLKDNDDINLMKEGIPLKDLYKHIYIPLESVYDYNNKRYCYYFPSWMSESYCKDENDTDKAIMNFNLYEIKIKDESNTENNETY